MKILKKIAIAVLILFILRIIALGLISFITRPTSDAKRNNEVDGVMMETIVSTDERKPIIKTYTANEYNKLSKEELEDIQDKVNGRIEGDIPCVHLLENKNIYFTFKKDGKEVELDKNPKIEITVSPSHYNDKSGKRKVDAELTKKDSKYIYEMNRYMTQYEKYFLEYSFVKVEYSVNGTDFVSVFGLFTSNAEEGTNYFDNERLEEPVPAGY